MKNVKVGEFEWVLIKEVEEGKKQMTVLNLDNPADMAKLYEHMPCVA